MYTSSRIQAGLAIWAVFPAVYFLFVGVQGSFLENFNLALYAGIVFATINMVRTWEKDGDLQGLATPWQMLCKYMLENVFVGYRLSQDVGSISVVSTIGVEGLALAEDGDHTD